MYRERLPLCSLPPPSFYDEIGTPLLSDIRVAYSKDAVEYVTQHLFPNYFNGSEIVIAGKLTNQSTESLHVQVQANSGDKSVVLESDVPLQESEKEMERRLAAADAGLPVGGYTERLWGFLSIKDALRSRLRSQSSWERDELGRQVANLSLAYNFLTPLTSMAVETPQVLFDNSLPDIAAATSSGLLEAMDADKSQREAGKPGPAGGSVHVAYNVKHSQCLYSQTLYNKSTLHIIVIFIIVVVLLF